MKDLLSHMVDNIVGEPVAITESEDNGFTVFTLNVPKDSVGIVIGKGGKTINAIKNVLKILAIKENTRVDIQVNEA